MKDECVHTYQRATFLHHKNFSYFAVMKSQVCTRAMWSREYILLSLLHEDPSFVYLLLNLLARTRGSTSASDEWCSEIFKEKGVDTSREDQLSTSQLAIYHLVPLSMLY